MENKYASIRTDITDWDSYENFEKVVRNLDFTSSPGYPYMKEKPTIGEWLEFNGLTCNRSQLERLWLDVQDVLKGDVHGLWRVFIKMEPHKLKKIEGKRYRLIMCPPLNIQVVWQMCFSEQNAKEIENSFKLPSQQGIILPGGKWKSYLSQWKRLGTTNGVDKTAWDWTCSWWILKTMLRLRKRLVYGDNNSRESWSKMASALYEHAFVKPQLLLSDGNIYQQVEPGVMKSGCVNTISDNSKAQVLLQILYSFRKGIPVEPLPRCCGDDTLQDDLHIEDLNMYESFGCYIKAVSTTTEFVGHEFRDTGPCPMYIGKHVFNICYQDNDLLAETLDSYLRLYCNTDEFYFWYDMALSLGLGGQVSSREDYRYWYHNPMATYKGILLSNK